MKEIHVLWTGGMDSTFRVVFLSRLPVRIIPYYIITDLEFRKSNENELNAINSITQILREHKDTKCVLEDIILITRDQIPHKKDISDAFQSLQDRTNEMNKSILKKWNFKTQAKGIHAYIVPYLMASQYEDCALLAYARNLSELEIGLAGDEPSIIKTVTKLGGIFKKIEMDIIGDNYILDFDDNASDLKTIFKNFSFPMLKTLKMDNEEFLLENGYEEISKLTWFCYTPIEGNKPCGTCIPCCAKIREGFLNKFSDKALEDNKKLVTYLDKIRNRFE